MGYWNRTSLWFLLYWYLAVSGGAMRSLSVLFFRILSFKVLLVGWTMCGLLMALLIWNSGPVRFHPRSLRGSSRAGRRSKSDERIEVPGNDAVWIDSNST